VLIGTGIWTQTGLGGTIFVDTSRPVILNGQRLLPNPMPAPTLINPPK
jgi:hypothetical protein